jgi:spatacsin
MQLLLFVDKAGGFGAHYPIKEVHRIMREKMPDPAPGTNNEKDYLLWHLKQLLPIEGEHLSTDIPPALVVYRAVHRTDQPTDITLLQEALNRKNQLYSLLATSVEGANIMLCALVTMLTISDAPSSLDVTKPPEHPQMVRVFLQSLFRLLNEKKSMELMPTIEWFSKTLIVTNFIHFYRAVELFFNTKSGYSFDRNK